MCLDKKEIVCNNICRIRWVDGDVRRKKRGQCLGKKVREEKWIVLALSPRRLLSRLCEWTKMEDLVVIIGQPGPRMFPCLMCRLIGWDVEAFVETRLFWRSILICINSQELRTNVYQPLTLWKHAVNPVPAWLCTWSRLLDNKEQNSQKADGVDCNNAE